MKVMATWELNNIAKELEKVCPCIGDMNSASIEYEENPPKDGTLITAITYAFNYLGKANDLALLNELLSFAQKALINTANAKEAKGLFWRSGPELREYLEWDKYYTKIWCRIGWVI
jgi:hypothetical protein